MPLALWIFERRESSARHDESNERVDILVGELAVNVIEAHDWLLLKSIVAQYVALISSPHIRV